MLEPRRLGEYNAACASNGWEAIQGYISTSINSIDPRYPALTGSASALIG